MKVSGTPAAQAKQSHTRMELLTPDQAAEFLGLSTSALAAMRTRGDGPVFIKMGGRRVLYGQDDLEAWVISRRRTSTADDTARKHQAASARVHRKPAAKRGATAPDSTR